MNRPPFPVTCGLIGMAVAAHGYTQGFHSRGPIDTALGVVFLLFLAWLLSSGNTSLVGADTHEDTSKSLAFRLGKSLNGIRRGFRR